ncbi:MAG: flagellar export protein FliJ [Pseudomonadota bacterium]
MKPFPLQAVVDLMQNRADETMRKLAQLITAEQSACRQLTMLEQYRDEYALRFQQAIHQGVSRQGWQNYQDFLARLDAAIEQQALLVVQQKQHTAHGQTVWQQQQNKLKAFDTLSERHQRKTSVAELRHEQKIQDEFAASRHKHDS